VNSDILIVDDEKLIRSSLSKALSEDGYRTTTESNGRDALKIFEKQDFDLVLLDVRLPDIDGIEVLKKIKQKDISCQVIIMTAYSGIKGAVEAIKLGAYDYVAKPFDIEEIKFLIARCLKAQKTEAEVNQIHTERKQKYSFEKIITNNSHMKKVISMCKKVALNDKSTVLILGESGTGKELIANAIHYYGQRSSNPFIAVNCAALAEGVLESELFGHEKGAFTGALKQKKGYIETAEKGTLFLDEIGEVSNSIQLKLLRFLEERSFQRVGGTKNIDVNVRVITATNRDLLREVELGNFREDLYYRLNVIAVVIPPMRDRKDDIQLLVKHFIDECNNTLNKNIRGCDNEALAILSNYNWPGNIRELRNIIERAVLLCEKDEIQAIDIPIEIAKPRDGSVRNKISSLDILPLDQMVNIYTKDILKRFNENKSQAAEALGITRQRLRRILSHNN